MTNGQSTIHRITTAQLYSYELFTILLEPYLSTLVLCFKNHRCAILQLHPHFIPLYQYKLGKVLVTVASPQLLSSFLLSEQGKPRPLDRNTDKREHRDPTSPLCLLLEHADANANGLRLVVPLHLKCKGYPLLWPWSNRSKQTA